MGGWYANVCKACSLHHKGEVTERWLICHIYISKHGNMGIRTENGSSYKRCLTINTRTRSAVSNFILNNGNWCLWTSGKVPTITNYRHSECKYTTHMAFKRWSLQVCHHQSTFRINAVNIWHMAHRNHNKFLLKHSIGS
jgi:hypothetical protein